MVRRLAGRKDNEMPGYLNVHFDFSPGALILVEQGGRRYCRIEPGRGVYVEKLIEHRPSLDSLVKLTRRLEPNDTRARQTPRLDRS